jgi:predicted Zn-dependent protease
MIVDLLDDVLRRSDGEVELSYLGVRQGTTRFANSRVTQSGAVEDRVIQARVAVGRRVGAARTNRLDAAAIGGVVDEARRLAMAQPESDFAGFDDGRTAAPQVAPTFDAETAAADASARARLIAPAFAATAKAGLPAAGLALTSESLVAVATSAGARRAYAWTSCKLDVIAGPSDASARLGRAATSLAAVEHAAAELAEGAVERALAWRDPITLPPGSYDVILEPAAIAELLEWLALTSLSARTVEDGSSCLAGRSGQRIAGGATIYDDAISGEDGCPTLPFDSEGTPKQRVTFIDEGVARGPAHDRATSARAHTRSTGHAAPLGDELQIDGPGGPTPQHLQLAPGTCTVEELLSQVDRGLWVSRFHYVNGLLDPRRALMTGMTRDGLFLVENGRRGRGVHNLRWTESFLEALGRTVAATRMRQVVAAGLSEAVYVAPTLLVRGWRFTG